MAGRWRRGSTGRLARLLRALEARLTREAHEALPPAERATPGAAAFGRLLRRRPVPVAADEVVRRLAAADAVVAGDYHPLPESKYVLATLLERLVAQGVRPVLTLGCLRAGPPELPPREPGAWLATRLRGWPFRVGAWELVARVAGALGVPVAGLRSEGEREEPEGARLEAWARRLRGIPRALIVVGEQHAAPENLPARLGPSSASLLLAPAGLYWRAPANGDPFKTAFCLGDVLALVPCHPLRRIDSYLAWQSGEAELLQPPEGPWCPAAWAAWAGRGEARRAPLLGALARVARYLGGRPGLLGEPDVLGPGTLDELDALLADLPAEEAQVLLSHVRRHQSFFHPGRGFVYLARRSLSHVGEELAHAVHAKLSPLPDGPVSPEEAFFQHVVREAVGFAGSKVVAPGRRAPSPSALPAARKWLRALRRGAVPPAPRLEGDAFTATVHLVGYTLGEALYLARAGGRLRASCAAALARRPLREPGQARAVVAELAPLLGR